MTERELREQIQRLPAEPIWHTKDLWIFFGYGAAFGVLIGFLVGLVF